MQNNIKIIGMDCATDPKKVGLAMGVYKNQNVTLLETKVGSEGSSIARIIANWINHNEKVILAIDAPLGWPEDLGDSLVNHKAGHALSVESNCLFRRETDRFIKKTLGKQPLDVGADRIARTAYAALKIIGELSSAINNEIGLLWSPENINGVSVIEVYPAATLKCYGMRNDKYKDKEQKIEREEILKDIKEVMEISCNTQKLIQNADVLDSAVCLIAAKDFLDGNVYFPNDLKKVEKEGWIWVKKLH